MFDCWMNQVIYQHKQLFISLKTIIRWEYDLKGYLRSEIDNTAQHPVQLVASIFHAPHFLTLDHLPWPPIRALWAENNAVAERPRSSSYFNSLVRLVLLVIHHLIEIQLEGFEIKSLGSHLTSTGTSGHESLFLNSAFQMKIKRGWRQFFPFFLSHPFNVQHPSATSN